MTDRELVKQWLQPGAFVPVDANTTRILIAALRERLAQPEPEPVACDCDSPAWCKQYKKCHRAMLGFEPYVAPPQREWKGLTDEEIRYAPRGGTFFDFARAIETKLKEKNT